MFLTQEADNAVRIVFCLAQKGERMDAASVADSISISQRFALKTLHKLVTAGFVKSFKGQNGGYELMKSPADITMNDIIETVDGPCFFSKCLDDNNNCTCGPDCRFRSIYGEISEVITGKLQSITFEMLLEGDCCCSKE